MKTAELTGVALDWAVCKAKGEYQCPVDEYTAVWMTNRRYSTDWLLGGPLIERERIATSPTPTHWAAQIHDGERLVGGKVAFNWRHKMTGPTPLIAAMRCFVASCFGDEIKIPEGLT